MLKTKKKNKLMENNFIIPELELDLLAEVQKGNNIIFSDDIAKDIRFLKAEETIEIQYTNYTVSITADTNRAKHDYETLKHIICAALLFNQIRMRDNEDKDSNVIIQTIFTEIYEYMFAQVNNSWDRERMKEDYELSNIEVQPSFKGYMRSDLNNLLKHMFFPNFMKKMSPKVFPKVSLMPPNLYFSTPEQLQWYKNYLIDRLGNGLEVATENPSSSRKEYYIIRQNNDFNVDDKNNFQGIYRFADSGFSAALFLKDLDGLLNLDEDVDKAKLRLKSGGNISLYSVRQYYLMEAGRRIAVSNHLYSKFFAEETEHHVYDRMIKDYEKLYAVHASDFNRELRKTVYHSRNIESERDKLQRYEDVMNEQDVESLVSWIETNRIKI